METNGKDYKVSLQIAGNPIKAHARIREQTDTEATLFMRLRMFTIGNECHLRNKKGLLRPVLFEDVYSLVLADEQAWVHLKLRFKHANTNDKPEDADAPIQIETPAYGFPIQCLVNVSAPRYMLVRTNLFAFIQKQAEGTLENPQTNTTRKIKIEEVYVLKDANGVPEVIIRIKYLEAAPPTAESKPDQDQVKHDTPIPPSDPHRPSVLLSNMPNAADLLRQKDVETVVTSRTKYEQKVASLKAAWKPIDEFAARYGKYGIALLAFVLVSIIGLVMMNIGNQQQGVVVNAPASVATTSQPATSTVIVSPLDTSGAPSATPVETSSETTQSAAPATSASAMPFEAPVATCIKMTPKNLRLFFLQSDPTCMNGKVTGTAMVASMHVSCAKEPAYDQARKCSDVSQCRICLPPNDAAKPGTHDFTDAMALAYFHQESASCFIEPSLPFRVDPKDLRNGLRMDLDCTDFSFDPIRGCFDYSKCKLIVPEYDK